MRDPFAKVFARRVVDRRQTAIFMPSVTISSKFLKQIRPHLS